MGGLAGVGGGLLVLDTHSWALLSRLRGGGWGETQLLAVIIHHPNWPLTQGCRKPGPVRST